MPRILLVEDNEISREILSRLLRKAGYQVEHAGDGGQALQIAAQMRPDLILMDMTLPVLDGWEATRELRSRGETIPVIAITAHTLDADRERALAAGCDDYEPKPVELPRLLQKIETLLLRQNH
jgi:two-component system cell cycle response regulator DivK